MMRRANNSQRKSRFYLLSIVLIIFLLGFLGIAKAKSSISTAKNTAFTLAKNYGHLTQTKAFYLYNREKVFYGVEGLDAKNKEVYAIISEDGKKLSIYSKNKVINQIKARQLVQQERHPKKITKLALGMYHNKPVWEVTYYNQNNKLCYDLLSLKDGHVMQSIQNI